MITINSLCLVLSVWLLAIVPFEAAPDRRSNSLDAEKSADYWNDLARNAIYKARDTRTFDHQARNAILFLGDGMGISTLTAARILKGQTNNRTGEEGSLYFEQFPNVALIKTYNLDRQVPDSAGTATAYLTGVKANLGTIGVHAMVDTSDQDCAKIKKAKVESVMEMARKAGKSIGIVTTTRVTHATPAGAYAHVAKREWEYDNAMPAVTRDGGCRDIAFQLINDEPGQSFNVILGGGLRNFLPKSIGETKGFREDGINLVEQWIQKRQAEGLSTDEFVFVENREQFKAIDHSKVKKVLGLFSESHLKYEAVIQEKNLNRTEPTLAEMTETAIRVLSNNPNGFLLLVEGGKIDLGHHDNEAKKALIETLEFDKAIERGMDLVDHRDTLVMVTADHSHGLTISGYPKRGNSIFSTTGTTDSRYHMPFTTLMYATGPGYREPRWQATDDTSSVEYHQYASVSLDSANHGGEDVAVYSRGPMSHLLRGLQEQNVIAHVMAFSTCIGAYSNEAHCAASGHTVASASSKAWIYVVVFVIILCGIAFYYYRRKQQL